MKIESTFQNARIEYNIPPINEGSITVKDLLMAEATSLTVYETADLARGGELFMISDDTFYLSHGVYQNQVILQRNDSICSLDITDAIKGGKLALITVIWSINFLQLECHFGAGLSTKLSAKKDTPPTLPSNKLIKWARFENLIDKEEYASEEELREKVLSFLLSIQDKIDKSGSFTSFWDTSYEGGRIIGRTPKREIEVQPVIYGFLSDQCLKSGIEIIPESKTGVGDLDFLFTAKLKDGGFAHFCAEFKNAHSSHLFHGITHQLPAYMGDKEARYGAYCVLNYRGEWFDEPKYESLQAEVNSAGLRSKNPHIRNIRVIIVNLSKPTSASKS